MSLCKLLVTLRRKQTSKENPEITIYSLKPAWKGLCITKMERVGAA
jgi:hypothetical protein